MPRWWTVGTLWTSCWLARAENPSDPAVRMYTPSVFRLGSGAVQQGGGHLPYTAVANPLGTLRPPWTESSGGGHLSEAAAQSADPPGTRPWPRLHIVAALLPFAIISILGSMMAPGAGGPPQIGRAHV